MMTTLPRWLVAVLVLAMTSGLQAAGTTAPATRPATPNGQTSFKPEELQQLAAPIALYPDSLLAQVLMASTYPVEIVQAERWATANKTLKGDALTKELEKKSWDPSVKSLVNFPQVLTMMSKELDWSMKLGNAFIADQPGVMAAVQQLRSKAQAQGNLKTTAEQKVTMQPTTQPVAMQPTTQPGTPTQIIQIESASPNVVYVPTYDATVVYGAWPYAAYPPYYYYPPGYVRTGNLLSFGAGVAVGAAWGYAWGGCNWSHGDVDVDINRNATFNQNIDRDRYASNVQNRSAQGGTNSFRHDPSHRQGVPYGDANSARQYGQVNSDAAKARESYRGRAEAGRAEIARTGPDQVRTAGANLGASPGSTARPPTGQRSYTGGASSYPPGSRTPAADRPSSPNRSPSRSSYSGGAFEGAGGGGSAARASSSRGQASRSSGYSSRSSGGGSASFSGGSRSGGGGGGGGRMGGGGRAGGGRR